MLKSGIMIFGIKGIMNMCLSMLFHNSQLCDVQLFNFNVVHYFYDDVLRVCIFLNVKKLNVLQHADLLSQKLH